jgi:hypothetical protein
VIGKILLFRIRSRPTPHPNHPHIWLLMKVSKIFLVHVKTTSSKTQRFPLHISQFLVSNSISKSSLSLSLCASTWNVSHRWLPPVAHYLSLPLSILIVTTLHTSIEIPTSKIYLKLSITTLFCNRPIWQYLKSFTFSSRAILMLQLSLL